jgi:UV DNA damage endonuclease
MRVGYACVNTDLPSAARTVRLANASPERLRALIAENLDALETILRWNAHHGIAVFRLPSGLIPLASHEANTIDWEEEFGERIAGIGSLARDVGARLSFHPGQYTVLTSERPEVVRASIAELEYHARLLRVMDMSSQHKIVLHVGAGRAGDHLVVERFRTVYQRLSSEVRARLVLENDERWPLADVLEIAGDARMPVVFDVFHHHLAPSLPGQDTRELILAAGATWREADGRPEVHFSTQQPGRRPGAHAETLDAVAFAAFLDEAADLAIDCVLEVKDKQRSALQATAMLDRLCPTR